MSYETGDRLTNAVLIEVDYKTYDGKLAIKCFTKSTERHFVSSPGEGKKKGDRVKKETVNVVKPFYIPIAFLLGCKPGEYVKLHYLVNEYAEEGPNLVVNLKTGEHCRVDYPSNFNQVGVCKLTGLISDQTTEFYSRRLDKKIAVHYFSLKSPIKPGNIGMDAVYYVTKIYRKGRLTRTLIKSSFSDGWIERATNNMQHVKAELLVWVVRNGVSARINLNLLKHATKV